LYDLQGRVITKTYTTANEGANKITWDGGFKLGGGIYTYELKVGTSLNRGKIVAQ